MTKTVKKRILKFFKGYYKRVDSNCNTHYCVLGAMAMAANCPLGDVVRTGNGDRISSDYADEVTQKLRGCLINKYGMTSAELQSLQTANDYLDWPKVTQILEELGIADKIAPYAVSVEEVEA